MNRPIHNRQQQIISQSRNSQILVLHTTITCKPNWATWSYTEIIDLTNPFLASRTLMRIACHNYIVFMIVIITLPCVNGVPNNTFNRHIQEHLVRPRFQYVVPVSNLFKYPLAQRPDMSPLLRLSSDVMFRRLCL